MCHEGGNPACITRWCTPHLSQRLMFRRHWVPVVGELGRAKLLRHHVQRSRPLSRIRFLSQCLHPPVRQASDGHAHFADEESEEQISSGAARVTQVGPAQNSQFHLLHILSLKLVTNPKASLQGETVVLLIFQVKNLRFMQGKPLAEGYSARKVYTRNSSPSHSDLESMFLTAGCEATAPAAVQNGCARILLYIHVIAQGLHPNSTARNRWPSSLIYFNLLKHIYSKYCLFNEDLLI